MNKHLTEIAYILDRSGSMGSMVEPAILGFNQFLEEQRSAPGQARLTLVLFDDEYLVPHQSVPIGDVPELTTKTYEPRATTALLDAIGRTIDGLGKRLASVPEDERPGQVIVAIFTDGLENASVNYDHHKISKMIRHQRERYNWQFLFLAANQDAIATAARMGIDGNSAATVKYSKGGIRSSASSMSRRVAAMRRFASTGEIHADMDAPMQNIASEEEEKLED
jgi:hypothetical protein